ncbi:PREDICTED: 3-ketoacyl-CoA synthase 7 [Populus euphratica]|uniref:3-ketoacyl-CoA synthase n=1 Tax=Populus euphratica TaxID=75702 RepID=A0AAJ6T6M3_POPEU|nr:PREDICTED: 3-ketoacyl-CoA synthase 7 [Populus euphratica]
MGIEILTPFLEAPFSFTPFFLVITLITCFLYCALRSNSVYLIDFTCYLPADNLRVTISNFIEHLHVGGTFNTDCSEFQERVVERSGIGDEACMPIALHELPPEASFKASLEEVGQVLFPIVEDLLSKHNISPKSIDILISNCSLFCPAPSITAMITNKFRFRSNIKSFSLSGMGCSAGLLSISLAKDLLKVHKNSLALVLSTEAISSNGYHGKTKSMLVTNTIFRMGGAAVLLSNKKDDEQRAKYKLLHLVRTHMGSDDRSYTSVIQQDDEEGFVGVSLSRSLLHVAGNALRTNISELGPLVLPYLEQLRYGWGVVHQKLWVTAGKRETYVPNFKKAFEHFCIHAGGRAIIDAVESNLKLQKEDGEASRMVLYRFGNTSSSSVWYELCYLEAKGAVKKGDRIWQIAFGSGFKCNSAVWKSISVPNPEERNAWSDRIHLYPVQTPIAP